jgi:4-hydroxyphenylpyruvate dioxygenase-like putative hemolysin
VDRLENETIAQIALVVDDIEKYLDAYVQVFGIERPAVRLTDSKDITHIRYKGKETNARAKLAFIRAANISIELIEPVGEPSTWADALKRNGPCVHHIAFRTTDKQQVIDKLGLPVTQTGDYKGGNYTYLDGHDKLAVDLEILESTS